MSKLLIAAICLLVVVVAEGHPCPALSNVDLAKIAHAVAKPATHHQGGHLRRHVHSRRMESPDDVDTVDLTLERLPSEFPKLQKVFEFCKSKEQFLGPDGSFFRPTSPTSPEPLVRGNHLFHDVWNNNRNLQLRATVCGDNVPEKTVLKHPMLVFEVDQGKVYLFNEGKAYISKQSITSDAYHALKAIMHAVLGLYMLPKTGLYNNFPLMLTSGGKSLLGVCSWIVGVRGLKDLFWKDEAISELLKTVNDLFPGCESEDVKFTEVMYSNSREGLRNVLKAFEEKKINQIIVASLLKELETATSGVLRAAFKKDCEETTARDCVEKKPMLIAGIMIPHQPRGGNVEHSYFRVLFGEPDAMRSEHMLDGAYHETRVFVAENQFEIKDVLQTITTSIFDQQVSLNLDWDYNRLQMDLLAPPALEWTASVKNLLGKAPERQKAPGHQSDVVDD